MKTKTPHRQQIYFGCITDIDIDGKQLATTIFTRSALAQLLRIAGAGWFFVPPAFSAVAIEISASRAKRMHAWEIDPAENN